VSAAFHDSDWQRVQEICLDLLTHEDQDVAGVAATCLGHLARIHGMIETKRVVPVLRSLLGRSEIAGQVNDALEDIEQYSR